MDIEFKDWAYMVFSVGALVGLLCIYNEIGNVSEYLKDIRDELRKSNKRKGLEKDVEDD